MDKLIDVITKHPLAVDSPDHLMPWGTRRDNYTSYFFKEKLYKLFPEKILRIIDFGCAGGGFVKDLIDDGHIAVGLEGSDWSKKMQRAAWPIISNFLFTCDITKPFEVKESGKLMKCDVITAWEVMEHIGEDDIARVAENVKKHLAPGGLFIVSINTAEDEINGVRLHQTVRTKGWWLEKFGNLGLVHLEKHKTYFRNHFVRSGDNIFHLVLSSDPALAPVIPGASWRSKIFDMWVESDCQRFLKRIVTGIE